MIDTRRLNNKSEEMNKKPFFVITNWLFIIMKYEKYSNVLREEVIEHLSIQPDR